MEVPIDRVDSRYDTIYPEVVLKNRVSKDRIEDRGRVRKATEHSPYAQAFLVLLEKLDVISEGDIS